MDFTKIIDFIKLSPRFYFAFIIFSGTLIFAPDEFILKLGMFEFVEKWRPVLGVILLLFSALLITQILSVFSPISKKLLKSFSYKVELKEKLKKLSKPEKKILYDYIDKNTKTQEFQFSDGVINGLVHSDLVYRSSNLSVFHTYYAYNIQPIVWDYLKKNFDKIFTQEEISEFRKENRKNR